MIKVIVVWKLIVFVIICCVEFIKKFLITCAFYANLVKKTSRATTRLVMILSVLILFVGLISMLEIIFVEIV